MQRLQAYQFELRTNAELGRNMRRFAGACRFVYNKALALQQERREAGEKHLGYAALCKHLTEWRSGSDAPWLKEAHSQIIQQSLKDLERAYQNFFEKRAAFPRFKKRGQHDSFRFPQGVTLDNVNGRVKLPKLGWIRYRNSRDVLGTIKKRHGKPVRWQVVHFGPDRARGRAAGIAGNQYGGHRYGNCPLRHDE